LRGRGWGTPFQQRDRHSGTLCILYSLYGLPTLLDGEGAVPVHPYLVKSLLIHYHIIFSLLLYTFKCAVVGKINNLSFFLSMRRYRLSHNTLPKTITKKYSNNYYLVSLEIYGIPYMKKVTEFREIPQNFTESYDTEFRGIPAEFQPIPHGIRKRLK
jgi:hypothetical protein